MNYQSSLLKKNIELIIMSPFVLAGKLAGRIFRLHHSHQLFIFCPSADIGGSIRVNADIAICLKDKSPIVIFSKKPKNNKFLHLFESEKIRTIDLHRYIDNKAFHFINFFYRGVIAEWINRVDHPVVVGGESIFFYKVLPHIKRSAFRADLCHLNTWFNYSQAFVEYLDARIFSTPKVKRDAQEIYLRNKVPVKYHDRLHFIDNKIPIPVAKKKINKPLSVIYIGRGAPQKRVHLVAEIAKYFKDDPRIHFSFVGDVDKIIDPLSYPYCTFYGNLRDDQKLEEIYNNSDVLLLTSKNEGLPLAVMEMMAYGNVIISTAVGGIPDYITDGENGFLIQDSKYETEIIRQAITILNKLLENPSLLQKISLKGREYAVEHFGGEAFCKNYRRILLH